MEFVSEKSLVSDSIWMSSVIYRSVPSECDVNFWVWSISVYVTSRPKIVDVSGWLTSFHFTSESIILEVSISTAVLNPDDLDFSAFIFSNSLGVYLGESPGILRDCLGNFATMKNFHLLNHTMYKLHIKSLKR